MNLKKTSTYFQIEKNLSIIPNNKNIISENKMENKKKISNTNITNSNSKWTKEDDNKLSFLIQKYSSSNWKEISLEIKKFSPIQCLHRWTRVIKPDLKKGHWTKKEDDILIKWVKDNGPIKWTDCSKLIPGRTGKQCREHYLYFITKDNKKDWSDEEDFKIFYLIKKYGTKWVKISKFFLDRNENQIKNRFYCISKKLICEKENINKNNKTCIKINKIIFLFDKIFKEIVNKISNKNLIISKIESEIREKNKTNEKINNNNDNNNDNNNISDIKKENENKNNNLFETKNKLKFIKKFYRIFKKHRKPQFNYTFKVKGKNLKNIPIKINKIRRETINNKTFKTIYFYKLKTDILNLHKINSNFYKKNLFNKTKIYKLIIKNHFINKNINEKKFTKKGKNRIRRQPYKVPIRNRNDIFFVSFLKKKKRSQSKKIVNKNLINSIDNNSFLNTIDLSESSLNFFDNTKNFQEEKDIDNYLYL